MSASNPDSNATPLPTWPATNPYWSSFPSFTPNPKAGIATEFSRLARTMNWEGNVRKFKKIEAYGSEIIFYWGPADGEVQDRANKLEGLQYMFEELGLVGDEFEDVRATITQCKKVNNAPVTSLVALKPVHINLVNLINHRRNKDLPIKKFATRKQLAKYTRKSGYSCPRQAAKKVPWVKVFLEKLGSAGFNDVYVDLEEFGGLAL